MHNLRIIIRLIGREAIREARIWRDAALDLRDLNREANRHRASR